MGNRIANILFGWLAASSTRQFFLTYSLLYHTIESAKISWLLDHPNTRCTHFVCFFSEFS